MMLYQEQPIGEENPAYFYQLVNDYRRNIKPKEFALVSLDIDNFNFINDLFSYEAGNAVLTKISEIFSQSLTEGEFFTRIHADSFLFFVKKGEGDELLHRFYEMTSLEKELEFIISPYYKLFYSGGIIPINDKTESLSSLMDKANYARKQAKNQHDNCFLFYDEVMAEELKWKKIITFTMEEALEKHEYEMYLQPKVCMENHQVIGAEALVRWHSKEHGIIYPDRFIDILEQNGFICRLDLFMLEQACIFLKHCKEEGKTPFPISVNFSKIHMRNQDFPREVYEIAKKHEVSPNLLEIELTETIFMDDFKVLGKIVERLKTYGFSLTLDDFGKAYSSLNYLKDLPLDVIKIDKAFLQATADSDKGKIVIGKVIELVKSLKMKTVMEGVETLEQVGFLQDLNCDYGQGYFYAKPMPVQDFLAFAE